MRSQTTTCHCNSQPLKIDLGPFARDERVDRIESILEILMESRFGSGGYYERLKAPMCWHAEAPVAYDLMPHQTKACRPFRACDQSKTGASGDNTNGLALASGVGVSWRPTCLHCPSTLARGSPRDLRPHINR